MNKRNISLVLVVLLLASLACSAIGLNPAEPTLHPTVKPTAEKIFPDATDTPVSEKPQPTEKPLVSMEGEGYACVGSKEGGAACLTEEGWKSYTEENGDFDLMGIQTMIACPEGIYAGSTAGNSTPLALFDGARWKDIPGENFSYTDAMVCDPDGGVWIGTYEGLAHYSEGEWVEYPSTDYSSADAYIGDLLNMAVDPDGTVWAGFESLVVSYDSSEWTTYGEGTGFEVDPELVGFAVDSKGKPWGVSYDALYWLDGSTWESKALDSRLDLIVTMAVDPEDRVLVGSSIGLHIYDGTEWFFLSRDDVPELANGIFAVAFDGMGRTWLGTSYGISVEAGDDWKTYLMSNADLPENSLNAVAVWGDGPALPEFIITESGGLKGFVTENGNPLKDLPVELCVETLILNYVGDTPCSNQPFHKETTTNKDGEFSFADLPTGYYVLVVQLDSGWVNFGFMGSSSRIPVSPGETQDMEELKVEDN